MIESLSFHNNYLKKRIEELEARSVSTDYVKPVVMDVACEVDWSFFTRVELVLNVDTRVELVLNVEGEKPSLDGYKEKLMNKGLRSLDAPFYATHKKADISYAPPIHTNEEEKEDDFIAVPSKNTYKMSINSNPDGGFFNDAVNKLWEAGNSNDSIKQHIAEMYKECLINNGFTCSDDPSSNVKKMFVGYNTKNKKYYVTFDLYISRDTEFQWGMKKRLEKEYGRYCLYFMDSNNFFILRKNLYRDAKF